MVDDLTLLAVQQLESISTIFIIIAVVVSVARRASCVARSVAWNLKFERNSFGIGILPEDSNE